MIYILAFIFEFWLLNSIFNVFFGNRKKEKDNVI